MTISDFGLMIDVLPCLDEGDMDIFALLNEIQAIARTGLHFTPGAYDRERYERLFAAFCVKATRK